MYYSYVQFCWCSNEKAVVLCILQLYIRLSVVNCFCSCTMLSLAFQYFWAVVHARPHRHFCWDNIDSVILVGIGQFFFFGPHSTYTVPAIRHTGTYYAILIPLSVGVSQYLNRYNKYFWENCSHNFSSQSFSRWYWYKFQMCHKKGEVVISS
jgi:hypothetical protein